MEKEIIDLKLYVRADLVHAKREFECAFSKELILPGQDYYRVTFPLAGIAGRVHADHVKPEYIQKYLARLRGGDVK